MKKHILLYTDDSGSGGVAQYNHSLMCGLVKLGYQVTCVQSHANNPLIDERQQLGIEHLWLEIDTNIPNSLGRALVDSSDAEKIFPACKPDLIIFSDCCPLSNFAAKQVARSQGIPYIIVIGFVAPYLTRLLTHITPDTLQKTYEESCAVIAVSYENLELLHKYFWLPANLGQAIYYGRPKEYFNPVTSSVRERLRYELAIPKEAVVCFTSGRLEAVKGYQYQVAAIELLKQSEVWPNIYFVWAGTIRKDASELIINKIKSLGVTNQVKILGQRWDIPDLLDNADIFILPSELEGMPLAVMEAMAKGLPVIASAVSGIPEELGETGKLLTDPKIDPEAAVKELAKTIEDWTINPQLRQSIGQNCRQRAEKMFTEERMIKETVEVIQKALLPKGDYVSPGLEIIQPDYAFPNMIVGDTNTCAWPYLRRHITHNWYVDKRRQTVGFLSRDEAHIIYNTALKFKGKKALEIGCWMGWSACHIALAGVELDVIDPLLSVEDIYESVSSSLTFAGVFESVNLVAGYSPQKVEELAKKSQSKWALIFIDGDHEAEVPLNDAIICEQFAEEDALILFHDLNAPAVAKGLDYLRKQGWNTMVYQTMQIMGVAWRGNIQPVQHQPDPTVNWYLPKHLQEYSVSFLLNEVEENLLNNEFISPSILVDGVFFQLYQTGIARVWKSLLEEWVNSGFAKHIIVLDRAGTAPKIGGVKYLTLPYYDYNNPDNDREMLQEVCNQEGADLFISSYYTTPITTPSVFMAYDMIPEVMKWDINEPMWQVKHQGIQHASNYIAISEHTARDLVKFFPDIPLESVNVAYCGVSQTFTPAKPDVINAFKNKYGITKPYFLLVGIGGSYKNSILFFQAIAELVNNYGFDIVGTGNAGILAPELRAYSSGITVHMLKLSDEELAVAYSGAVALVYPSKYEGFGMPIVEAMACGCPVITCANASIPEVAGEAAIYVPDNDVDELANALCEIQKPGVRNSLIRAGLEQAKKFSWVKMAETVSSVLVDTTLLYLNLQDVNLIIFPDWSTDEEKLGLELARIFFDVVDHFQQEATTLLIDTTGVGSEEADLLISAVVMNIMLEQEIDVTEKLQISLLSEITPLMWKSLLPKLHGYLKLDCENKLLINQLNLPKTLNLNLE
ncbi:glycosyltransferase [Cronbergia sp. UHCC 0137]|uniref:glycosyltransferase n=1 Tax=Cronbergia sp. UHCC 0137 TaxID=3110239 RepID=UPI003A4C5203